MDKMKMMFSVEAAKAMVANENKRHKQMILGQAICVGLISFIFMAFYWARFSSVDNIQKLTKDYYDLTNQDLDFIAYDTGCGAPYSDAQEAANLLIDLAQDCYTDEDCRKAGSRWSHIYVSMGTILLLVFLTTICVCIGVY